MGEGYVRDLPSNGGNECKGYRFRLIWSVIIASAALILGCSTSNKPRAEAPPPSPTLQVDQPQEISKLPPAELNQVQEAVKRVFKESVVVDASRKPAFVTGDFNGDLSQDIAVVLKPVSEKLADLNEEFPAWILRDLSASRESAGPRLRIAADEVLLAVIHGFGNSGWHDPEATQTFLLKHAAGSNMEAQTAKTFLAANQGRKLPGLRGDVVAEVLDGKSGCLYYVRSSYAWYDPRTYTGEPEPRRGHGAPDQAMKK